MKTILIAIAILFTTAAEAKVTKVTIQASGLTCSMCSNAIQKALKTVSSIDQIRSNIKTSTFEITFKPDAKVDFDLLKKKVEGAGFFVSNFTATVRFEKQQVSNDDHITVDNTVYHFVKVNNQVISGEKTVKILDKGFVSAKEYKKNAGLTKMQCYKTGVAAACCSKAIAAAPGTRIFHVTI